MTGKKSSFHVRVEPSSVPRDFRDVRSSGDDTCRSKSLSPPASLRAVTPLRTRRRRRAARHVRDPPRARALDAAGRPRGCPSPPRVADRVVASSAAYQPRTRALARAALQGGRRVLRVHARRRRRRGRRVRPTVERARVPRRGRERDGTPTQAAAVATVWGHRARDVVRVRRAPPAAADASRGTWPGRGARGPFWV